MIRYKIMNCRQNWSQTCEEHLNNHINREEAKRLVKRFDGEFPQRYFEEIMDYLEIKPKFFFKLCDKFRSPHLWKKVKEATHTS